LLVCPVFADEMERLLGSWKLVAFFTEDTVTRARINVYGEHPHGYASLEPSGRAFSVVTADGRKPPHTSEEQALAFRTMVAYSGKYRLEGNKFITAVDTAWNEDWVGTEQVRFYQLQGDTLYIRTAPIPNPDAAGRMMIGTLVWERER